MLIHVGAGEELFLAGSESETLSRGACHIVALAVVLSPFKGGQLPQHHPLAACTNKNTDTVRTTESCSG